MVEAQFAEAFYSPLQVQVVSMPFANRLALFELYVEAPVLKQDVNGLVQQALRLYGIFFGFIILLAETEWERFLASARHFER